MPLHKFIIIVILLVSLIGCSIITGGDQPTPITPTPTPTQEPAIGPGDGAGLGPGPVGPGDGPGLGPGPEYFANPNLVVSPYQQGEGEVRILSGQVSLQIDPEHPDAVRTVFFLRENNIETPLGTDETMGDKNGMTLDATSIAPFNGEVFAVSYDASGNEVARSNAVPVRNPT